MTTDYHAKYWANLLIAQSDTTSDITSAIAQAKVDLNPHQVEAASFALGSPLSNGVILADEVGLGKTIEAGLVLLQLWSRRQRRLLIIAPATLRRQWASELAEKFGLPAKVLDVDAYKTGGNPFDDQAGVLICSYHFAAQHQTDVKMVAWDRIVFDEAHQLRNVWKKQSQRAKVLASATRHAQKLLLTATPLQNSLMELYGLVQFIDEHVFGDEKTFRAGFSKIGVDDASILALKERLNPVVKRTLRRQVREYVKFTSRVPITQDFIPTEDESALYDLVSEYLQREDAYALPKGQRSLMTLILRKILASSPVAIGATLLGMAERLERDANSAGALGKVALDLEIDEDYDGELEPGADVPTSGGRVWQDPKTLAELEGRRIEAAELRRFAELAFSVRRDAKAKALLEVLPKALEQATGRGARRKAVIFTESKRTQRHLVEMLEANGYAGEVLTINGPNTEALSQELYGTWRQRRLEAGLPVANRAADTKSAIVEAFRDGYTILVATEAAAEGLNLQFCSLVINYDLPWNPQRIEQRIGRCHRYGQQHDVVVVNFLNRSNAADQRVFELLDEKFKLFSGVFGASDEVLGALASGLDLEKRIADVYQRCRTAEQIDREFDRLRAELEAEIGSRMDSTRATLLEDFDDEVLERLDVEFAERRRALDARQEALWRLTRHETLRDGPSSVVFDDDELVFEVTQGIQLEGLDDPIRGRHALDWSMAEARDAEFYHHATPLAETIIRRAAGRKLEPARLVFYYGDHQGRIGALEPLKGKTGHLAVQRVAYDSADSVVELVLTGVTETGETVDAGQLARMFGLPKAELRNGGGASRDSLGSSMADAVRAFEHGQRERLEALLDEESSKLDRWAEDLKQGLELEIRELDRDLKEATKQARQTTGLGLQEKLLVQRQKQDLERRRSRKRRELFDQQDEIDSRRDELLSGVEAKLSAQVTVEEIFVAEWELF